MISDEYVSDVNMYIVNFSVDWWALGVMMSEMSTMMNMQWPEKYVTDINLHVIGFSVDWWMLGVLMFGIMGCSPITNMQWPDEYTSDINMHPVNMHIYLLNMHSVQHMGTNIQ